MRYSFLGADTRLSAQVLNEQSSATMIALHGMRDQGESFRLLAEAMPEVRLIIPDLRGHGRSDHPGVYSMTHFVADLLAVYRFFGLASVHLLGHSLGGHIVSRFSGMFPERVDRLIIADGFGPPRPKDPPDTAGLALGLREQVETLWSMGRGSRPMQNLTVARERYQHNNPNLSQARIAHLVQEGTRELPTGDVGWRWDPRVQQVWNTFSHADSESLLSCIRSETCVITGSEGLAYWLRMHPELAGQDLHYQRELQRRIALFSVPVLNVVLKGAGHMVHYDAPEAFCGAVQRFIGAGST